MEVLAYLRLLELEDSHLHTVLLIIATCTIATEDSAVGSTASKALLPKTYFSMNACSKATKHEHCQQKALIHCDG